MESSKDSFARSVPDGVTNLELRRPNQSSPSTSQPSISLSSESSWENDGSNQRFYLTCPTINELTKQANEMSISSGSNPEQFDEEKRNVINETTILNIDTGERIPISRADEVLPKNYVNPLTLHLMQLTNDYNNKDETGSVTSGVTVSDNMLHRSYDPDQDDDDDDDDRTSGESKKGKLKKKMKSLKKIGSGIMKGVKGVKSAKERSIFHVDLSTEGFPHFKIKMGDKKDTPDFEGLRHVQELCDCKGAIWCMKFSVCGQLLAVAGQDQLLRVYCSQKSWKYFTQLRNKASGQQISPNSSKERDNKSFSSQRSSSLSSNEARYESATSNLNQRFATEDNTLSEEGPLLLFSVYKGHTGDVLDISWSKNHFLLSSSMDKTVRLWHITRIECLCTFRHIDFVTTIQFHPRDDRYFLSGSLDGKLRLWNIPDKRVTLWNEVMALSTQKSTQESAPTNGLITSSAFVQNGMFAVIGTYDGRIIFYTTDQLKYFTQLNVSSNKNLLTLGQPNSSGNQDNRRNKKVTGIEGVDDNKILVTTNDSRIRLYDLRDLSLTCKYSGCQNQSSQIKASVSHDSKYIICGSENSSFYIWKLKSDNLSLGQRRDRNKHYECVRLLPQPTSQSNTDSQMNPPTMATSKIVTSAIYAPVPGQIDESAKYVIAAADFNGFVRIFCK